MNDDETSKRSTDRPTDRPTIHSRTYIEKLFGTFEATTTIITTMIIIMIIFILVGMYGLYKPIGYVYMYMFAVHAEQCKCSVSLCCNVGFAFLEWSLMKNKWKMNRAMLRSIERESNRKIEKEKDNHRTIHAIDENSRNVCLRRAKFWRLPRYITHTSPIVRSYWCNDGNWYENLHIRFKSIDVIN